jgi:hypothetical protein
VFEYKTRSKYSIIGVTWLRNLGVEGDRPWELRTLIYEGVISERWESFV